MSFTVTPLERREEEVFPFGEKEGFEFFHSPEHAFTSGAIYYWRAEIFIPLPFSHPIWGLTPFRADQDLGISVETGLDLRCLAGANGVLYVVVVIL